MNDYTDSGAGQGLTSGKLKERVWQGIERVVDMSQRHTELKAAGDWVGLLTLADEYELRGMTRTAKGIRIEAEEMRK